MSKSMKLSGGARRRSNKSKRTTRKRPLNNYFKAMLSAKKNNLSSFNYNGKKYVGKTNNVDRRMVQHFKGNGAQVTKKFKPIEGEVIDSCNGYFSNNIEQKHTEKYINKHGYNNVRGGSYTNSKTLHYSKK